MRTVLLRWVVSLSILAGVPAFAANGAADPVGPTPAQPVPADERTHTGKGTVRQVDQSGGRVRLAHEPIESLGWAGKTQDFVVSDREQLTKLRPGQQVQFSLKPLANQYVIGEIRPIEQPAR